MLIDILDKVLDQTDPENYDIKDMEKNFMTEIIKEFNSFSIGGQMRERVSRNNFEKKEIEQTFESNKGDKITFTGHASKDIKEQAKAFLKAALDKLTYEKYKELAGFCEKANEFAKSLKSDFFNEADEKEKDKAIALIGEKAYNCLIVLQTMYADYLTLCYILGIEEEASYMFIDKAVEMFPPDQPIEGETLPDIYKKLPASPQITHFAEIIGSGKTFDKLKARKEKYDRHKNAIQVGVKGNETRVVYSKGDSKTAYIIEDINKLAHNAHQRKIFRHLMSLVDKQCISNGYVHKYEVSFPLSDLIGDNLYKNEDTARRGFARAMNSITGVKVMGVSVRKGKGKDGKKTEKQADMGVLFYHARVKNNYCTVFLNDQINWNFVNDFYTIIPSYHLQLTDNGSDLLANIFELARQNGDKLKRGESFNIGFREICYKLNLPTEEEVAETKDRQYKRWIVKPLNDALNELQKQNDRGYSITVHANSGLPIGEYLNKGYIEIAVNKDSPYFAELTAMDERQKQIIANNAAKAEKKEIAIQAAVEVKKQSKKE